MDWLKKVHGAKLLYALFEELSLNRLNYKDNKVNFSVWLTNWLLEHDREHLSGLAEFLKGVVGLKAKLP